MTLPNGNFLPLWTQGWTMMERFDHYYEAQNQSDKPPSVPTVSQLLYEVSMGGVGEGVQQREVQLGFAKDEDELRSLEVMANEVRKRIEKKRNLLGELEIVKEKAPMVPPEVKDPRVKQEKQKAVVSSAGGGVKAVPRPEVEVQGAPQFHYHSAVEDSSLVKAVLDRTSSGTVEV